MTQIVGVIGGKNKVRDYHFQHTVSALIEAGVVSGLEVTVDSVSIGSAFIEVARTAGATFKVPFFSSEVEAITTGINQKIFIEIGQTNIDDGDLNNSIDGTGIGTITVAASFPAGNYIPLASSDGAGAITDLRVFIEFKKALQNLDGISGDINTSGDIYGTFFYGDGSNITGLTVEVNSTSLNVMMGVNGDALGEGYSKVDYEQLDFDTEVNFGTTTQPIVAQSFYGQLVDITTIPLMIRTEGSPDDGIYFEIQTDNAGEPSGTVVTNGTSNTIDYTALSGVITEEDITFASVPVITEGEITYLVPKRTGANSDVNYYVLGSAGSDAQIGTLSTNNGSVWATATNDLYFKLPGYKLAVKGGDNFLGTLQGLRNIGEIGKFNTGYCDKQTNLIEGNTYTYNTTTGVIESGNDFKAISETELDLRFIDEATFNNKDYKLLATSESSSSVASVDFNDLWQYTDYKSFKIIGYAECATTDDLLRVLTSGNSTVGSGQITNSQGIARDNNSSLNLFGHSAFDTVGAHIMNSGQSNGADKSCNFTIELPNIGEGASLYRPCLDFNTGRELNGGSNGWATGQIFHYYDFNVRSIRFKYGTGNIRKHKIQVFGIK